MSHYPAVEISGLHFSYPDGTAALRGVEMEVRDNEKTGLLGANGAGKSTLLLHLNGILPPSQGEVRIYGLPVSKKTANQVRRRIGLIFQNPDDQLFCPTVFDDVAFGARQLGLPEDEVEHRVAHALEESGAAGLELKSPFHLSYGQKKLVSIATVLAMDARVLVFDEPTTGLDPRARNQIIELLISLGRTQIIASHDFDLLRRVCSRVVLLHNGVAAAQGDTSAILEDEDLLKKCGVI